MGKVAIVIPVRERKYDLVIVANKSKAPGRMRDEGAGLVKAEILAFMDYDSFPDFVWLDTAVKIFEENPNVAVVTGPNYTPPTDGFWEQVSGIVYSKLGGWRYKKVPQQKVYDVPSCNMLVRKKVFDEVGGFDTDDWPGEDTILCEKVLRKGYDMVCDPGVVVWHHRRNVKEHLRQISRYAKQRGRYVKLYPQTSAKWKYWVPAAVVLLLMCTILTYGVYFIRGFVSNE